jgi:hypothetical protein
MQGVRKEGRERKMKAERVEINMESLHGGQAKIAEMTSYLAKVKEIAGDGNEVVLTGAGPIWLYLKVAHALHGKALRLLYRSPGTGEVVIFDHDPW